MLAKYTQREIKRLWLNGSLNKVPENNHGAIDTSKMIQIGYNAGIYGCNAEIYKDDNNQLFIVNYRISLPKRA